MAVSGQFSGESRVAAPLGRVRDAVVHKDTVRAVLPGCRSVDGTEATGFRALLDGPPLTTVSWQVTGADRNRVTIEGQVEAGSVVPFNAELALAEEGPFTRVRYEGRAESGDAQAMARGVLERFAAEVAGPAKVGAQGVAGAAEAVTRPGPGFLAMVPSAPFGLPLLSWACGAIFLFIVLNLFAPYLR